MSPFCQATTPSNESPACLLSLSQAPVGAVGGHHHRAAVAEVGSTSRRRHGNAPGRSLQSAIFHREHPHSLNICFVEWQLENADTQLQRLPVINRPCFLRCIAGHRTPRCTVYLYIFKMLFFRISIFYGCLLCSYFLLWPCVGKESPRCREVSKQAHAWATVGHSSCPDTLMETHSLTAVACYPTRPRLLKAHMPFSL